MTDPQTTPTPVDETTVLPRNPDGSPLPKAEADEKLEEQAIADVIRAMAKVAETLTYEDHFVTTDRAKDGTALRFDLIESEDGGTYWGYGHVEPADFRDEVNRWLIHVGMDIEDRVTSDTKVGHLWARMTKDGDEFVVADPAGTESDADLFPVTRVSL